MSWDKNAFISEDPQIIPERRILNKFGNFSALFLQIWQNSAAKFSGPQIF
jgi:hypothetical protein